MFHKIISLTAAVLCATLTVAASAPSVSVPPKESTNQVIDRMVNACRQGYVEFKSHKYTANEALDRAAAKFTSEQKPALLIICVGYGEGYEDGRRGLS